ncbi:hypothetical protein CGCSCA1_v012343 [Colletotrichum siamense]|nr:hypothetical protein CGCSCA1_v012343 [Colletotrichum siamense]
MSFIANIGSAVDEDIISLQVKVSAVACDDPENPRLHYKLAQSLLEKYQGYGKVADDLSAAIFQATTAVEKADILDPAERDEMAATLSRMVFLQWDQLRTPESLEAALERGLQTTTLLSDSSPHFPMLWYNLAKILLWRGKSQQDEDDLEAALQCAKDAADCQKEDDFYYPLFCYTISEVLFRLSHLRSSPQDLEESLSQLLESKRTMRVDHPMQYGLHRSLESIYKERFRYTLDYVDIVKASSYFTQRSSMPPPPTNIYEDGHRPSIVHLRRFDRSKNICDLDEAIRQTKNERISLGQNSVKRASASLELAEMFGIRFSRLGEVQDAKEGIYFAKEGLDLRMKNNMEPIGALQSLCCCLFNHNEELDVSKEVEETINIITSMIPVFTTMENQADLRTLLGMMLRQRSQHDHQNVGDLENGITQLREALQLSQSETQKRTALDILTACLHDHFNRTGDESSMNEAVSTGRRLVSLLNREHEDWNRAFIQLARQLTNRALRTGNAAELDEAISIYEDVSDALPDDHFLRLRNVDALSTMYNIRYDRKRQISDNDKAIVMLKDCINRTTQGSQERAIKLLNLGSSLSRRFRRTRLLTHLEEAISKYEEALETPFTQANQSVKASCLYSMAQLRHQRYEITGEVAHLDMAVEQGRLAVTTLADSHPELARAHSNLGSSLQDRATETGRLDDIDSALNSFKTGCHLQSGEPIVRINCARGAMGILAERNDWAEAERIADVAVGLIPRACSRKLSQDDQVHALRNISEVSADACSILLRLGKVEKALQHIEYGRGLVLGYLIDEQSDLSDLRMRDFSLAQEYEYLRARASSTSTDLEPIYQEMDVCESKIRQIEGFERFLLPPSLAELQDVASEGPIVVVNTSRIGADAIIITKHCFKAVELPEMSSNWMIRGAGNGTEDQRGQRDIKPERAPRLNDMALGWLWSACVHPILKQITKDLGQKPSDADLPRMWWIGTGHASSFPFHAATSSNAEAPGSTLDLTISSYTSTIKALQNARNRALRGQEQDRVDPYNLLVVTMPSTPGGAPLPGVTRELQAIKTAVDGTYNITELEKPNARQVLDGMQDAQIVHFACHGTSDPLDPLQSHLLLQTSDQDLDKLTVKSLMAAKVQTRSWIAYLSACSTAEVSASNLKNEGLHATSAFQAAGFGHVIGSMWPVSDDVSIEVAQLFYEFLSKPKPEVVSPNRLVAEALRNAVVEVRKRHPDNADVWAPYIHYGA